MNWQPMDTAPKDREILVWLGEYAAVAEWLPYGDGGEWIPGKGISAHDCDLYDKPKLWAELEPPK